MAGKSPVCVTQEQRKAIEVLATSADRAEAYRARALLLTLSGWASARIREAFGVREDMVLLWRSAFTRNGVDGLKTRLAPGLAPLKTQAARRVAEPLRSAPVAFQTNWPLARLAAEIEAREGFCASRSPLSKVLCKKGTFVSAGRATHRRVSRTQTRSHASVCDISYANDKPRPSTSSFFTQMRARR
jgi:hypothetical protein